MFGYVKPLRGELLVKEYEFYRATYCGVCRAMKKHTGALSNCLHSYDSVFLALVRMLYIDQSQIGARRARCIAHPVKRRGMLKINDALEYTAKAFAILTYYKVNDDYMDEKLLRKMAAGIIRPVFKRAKRKAKLQSLSDLVCEKLAKTTLLEKAKTASVDEPAALFGEALGAIFSYGLTGRDERITYQLGYHLGKFIYAIDAAEDYEKDLKSGSYNPYVLIYEGKPLTKENRESIKCALLMECRSIEGAVNLLPFGDLHTIEGIVTNIIYRGLPEKMKFLDGENNETKENENDRSI